MISAIVLAAGSGKRMNTETAKQFLKIYDKEVLYYSLKTFDDCDKIDQIVLVTKEEDVEYCKKEIVEKYNISKVVNIIPGGRERYDSVYAGLKLLADGKNDACEDLVMIHDGARPFVTGTMIYDSIEVAKLYGACSVGVPVKDTIKIVDEKGFSLETPDRNYLYQVQTPQTFKLDLILSAYKKFKNDDNHNITDDTMLVEQYTGVKSKIIFGAYENIKITTPDDMEIAEKIVEKIF